MDVINHSWRNCILKLPGLGMDTSYYNRHEVLVDGTIQYWGTTTSHNPWGPEVMYNGQLVATPGPVAFGGYFFGITGFHGFHVFSGVVINLVMLIKTKRGDFQKRGHYEMIEKAGLYWHFVDLGVGVCFPLFLFDLIF